MKAYQIMNEGGIDDLALNEIAKPTPGKNEVLVRVKASSINSRDLSTVKNPASRNLNYPCIPNSPTKLDKRLYYTRRSCQRSWGGS